RQADDQQQEAHAARREDPLQQADPAAVGIARDSGRACELQAYHRQPLPGETRSLPDRAHPVLYGAPSAHATPARRQSCMWINPVGRPASSTTNSDVVGGGSRFITPSASPAS